MIDGVLVVPLKRIPDERGTVMHMLKRTDPHFIEFVRSTSPQSIRASSRLAQAQRDDLNYACIHGRIKLVLFDDREGSATNGD